MGNVEVAESHFQACASRVLATQGTGKFPADLALLKIAGWGWVCLLRCTLLSSLLLLLVCSIHETEQNSYCQQIITEKHLAELEELADTQMQHPGRVSFKFIDKMQLKDPVCYVKAAFPLLGKILERTEFKENSSNAKKMQMVRRMYSRIDENVDPCIREEDDKERKLSQMCFKEFTTSPYEMLVLVKQFFQDIDQLLQNQETFEKDCSQVYQRTCMGPKKAGSSPGVGTDPDCNCLSPALPSATQPSLSAATHASREVAPASTRVPSSLLHATLTDLDAPSQPPSSMDGGSGTEEVLGAGVGDTASVPSPAMQQTAPTDSAEALLDPAGTLSLVAVDVSILRGDGELVEGGIETVAGHPPQDPAQQRAASVLPDHPSGLRTTTPAASPSAGSPLIYITVASVVAVLLAMGGLLFYKYKSRVLERPLEDGGCDPEEPERRALQGAGGCPELETQEL
ncbi:PREDICTED: macrophage colony-stimulating factor 1 [Nipponia nippon]|uniref:macrophage colony-stimulating factor 1 n=1 Tax=Nipponia nippon TaxID=128390 RepID=UPI000511326C|nr:PREDICTED: macrophage colony-stimulating factor 1 [Nipponia nippon]